MADNVTIPATGSGTATPVVATDEVSSAHYQRVKLDGGGDGLSVPIVAGQQLAAGSVPVVLTAAQVTTLTPPAAITGFATSAKQDTGNTSLASIDGKITAVNTGAVVVASSALPAGASTSAKQDTEITSLASIDGKITAVNTGAVTVVSAPTTAVTGPLTDAQLRATAVPVSLASAPTTAVTEADGANVTLGAKADAKSTATDTTPITAMSVWKQISSSVQALVTALGSPFQAGGSIGNTTFAATQGTASNLKAQVIGAGVAGTADAGVVTVQGIASMTKLLVTPDSVALPANQSVNVAQVAGATAAVGSGVLGTGTQRVTLATDDAAVATLGATTGAAVITDANGTIQQYLRGIVKLLITSGTVILGTGANLIGYVGGKNTYAGKTTLTTTNFTSLANGSGWQSASIATSGARDVHVEIQTKGQTSGSAYVDFYVAETLSNGTIYTDAATGTEGTFTAAGRLNSRYIGSVKCNAGTNATQGAFKLSDIFAVIPTKFAFIAINNTGASMSATAGDHVFDYELVN